MNVLRYILMVCLLFGMGSALWADVGRPVMDAAGNVIGVESNIKTPPLRTSDRFRIPLELHNPFPISNFAGFRVKFHILDGKEISVTPQSTLYGIAASTEPPPGTTIRVPDTLVPPTFPQSTQAQTVPFFRTVWHPNAQNSGGHLPASAWFNLLDLSLHAKSTTPRNNSDVDMTVMAWNIRHLRQGPGSTHFEPSALVWASSNFVPTPEQPIPSFPRPFDDPNAHWKHIPFPWHMPAGIGSQFIATLAGTAFIGLEHVPEPMTAVLALSGAAMLICSWALRRRRLSL